MVNWFLQPLRGDRRRRRKRSGLRTDRPHRGLRLSIKSPMKKPRPPSGGLGFGAPAGTRTPDTLLKRQVLYLLSYWGVFSNRTRFVGPRFCKKGSCSAASPQIETRRSGFDLERKRERCGLPLTPWLGWRDSNPLYRSQSPVCYHYTTSQYSAKRGRRCQPLVY